MYTPQSYGDQAYWDLLAQNLGATQPSFKAGTTSPFAQTPGVSSPFTAYTPGDGTGGTGDTGGGGTGATGPAVGAPITGAPIVSPPSAPFDAGTVQFTSAMTPDQFIGGLKKVYAQHGQTLDDAGLQTWSGYWNDWGKNDPNTFLQRLNAGLAGTGAGTGGATGTGGVTGTGGSGAVDLTKAIAGVTPTNSADMKALIDRLTGISGQSLVVNPNDAVVKAQTDAFAASEQRQLRNYLTGVAETGGPNANVTAQTLAANEAAAQADAGFTGQVLASELTARRAEIQSALAEMGTLLTGDQQRQLQAALAQLDAAIAQAQLQQGAFQFDVNQGNVLAGVSAH